MEKASIRHNMCYNSEFAAYQGMFLDNIYRNYCNFRRVRKEEGMKRRLTNDRHGKEDKDTKVYM
jgi:hypothetical protein